MNLETDIIDSLQSLGYNGPCLHNDILGSALKTGISSHELKQLILFLTNEIHVLQKTDEAITTIDENDGFLMELSSMLKELQCPFTDFTSGPISSRFQTKECLFLLLEYLISELMTIRMCRKNSPEAKSYEIQKFESTTAKALVGITKQLQLGKPPENIAAKALFDKVAFKLEEKARECNPKRLREPLFKRSKPLTDEQWSKLEKVCKDLEIEYNKRRQVLITRLEVTIQSFSWSDRTKQKESDITRNFRNNMLNVEELKTGGKRTDIAALLAARTDLPIIEKTSCSNVRKNTQSSVNKHIIGNVPDRGGRAYEHAVPAPEMPSWQIQRSQGGGGRAGGRGGFDQRPQGQRPPRNQQGNNWVQESGRVQGAGWTQKGGGNYNDNRNNYQDNRGGYQDNRNSGGYQDNRGGYQDNRNSGGYQGGNNQQDNNRGGNYQGGNNYQDNRGGNYNRNQGNSYNDNRDGGGYQNRGGHSRGRGHSNYNRGGQNNRR